MRRTAFDAVVTAAALACCALIAAAAGLLARHVWRVARGEP